MIPLEAPTTCCSIWALQQKCVQLGSEFTFTNNNAVRAPSAFKNVSCAKTAPQHPTATQPNKRLFIVFTLNATEKLAFLHWKTQQVALIKMRTTAATLKEKAKNNLMINAWPVVLTETKRATSGPHLIRGALLTLSTLWLVKPGVASVISTLQNYHWFEQYPVLALNHNLFRLAH